MKCSKCGALIEKDARFCSQCGTPIAHMSAPAEAPAAGARVFKQCPQCLGKAETDEVYCSACGRLLQLRTLSGSELLRIKFMSFYEGEPTVGIAKATGDLVICDDRICFQKVMGNAIGGLFGIAGMGVSRKSVQDKPIDSYPLSGIASAREGRYAGVMPMIVVTFKDGKCISFCGTAGGEKVDRAVRLIEEYRKYN